MSDDRFTAAIVAALPVPAKGNRFHGFKGAEASLGRGRFNTVIAPGGFGIVVTSAGSRSYVLNYVFAGRERRYTIGKCVSWTPADAINKARELRRDIDNGIDPLAERQIARAPAPAAAIEGPVTVGDLCAAWLEQRSGASISQRSAFRKHINPTIGAVPFKALQKSQVAAMHTRIRKTGGDQIADRTLSYLGAVLRWQATREDNWQAPSFAGLNCVKPAEHEREHTLSDDDIRALWPVWEGMGAAGQLCQLLLLTGQRRGEIGDLLWSEVDLENASATIPKTRYKTRRAHTFPFSTAAMEIVRALSEKPRKDGRLFPHFSYSAVKRQLDALCRRDPDWHFHDERRTAASIMFSAGVSEIDCDEVLGHVRRKITRVYIRDRQRGGNFMDAKRAAVEVLAREIKRILNNEPAAVIELAARRA